MLHSKHFTNSSCDDDDDDDDGLPTSHDASWCLPVTIPPTEQSSHCKEGGRRVMPGPHVALQRRSEPAGDQLAPSAPPCLEENEEGEDMKRSPRGLSKGGTGSTQAQHCLHPTSALILVHNLGLSVCSQGRPTNIPSPTAELTGLGG